MRFKSNKKDHQTRALYWQIENLYQCLDSLYGTQGLVLRASKLDAIDLITSGQLEKKILGLHRILAEDPTITELKFHGDLEQEAAYLEDLLAEESARRSVEADWQKRVQEKVDQNYQVYVRDLQAQLFKEQNNSPENARTLKKLGLIEKMERTGLNRSALELLRPNTLEELIGQEKALTALLAKLNTPYPQHLILYGPPGVGKTSCARLALEMIKGRASSCFTEEAPFVEVDGTTLRWDPREATNPLLGSVHDPIYQGARSDLAEAGIPEPKLGLVTEAHGGILFIDEIGEMDPELQNKLLKVLEDKRVYFDSSYYDPHDERVPQYIKQIFENGLPADFILIGATTRSRESISPALRSRCMEVFFEPLTPPHIQQIVQNSAHKLGIDIEPGVAELISQYTSEGRSANKLLVDAYALALNETEELNEPLLVLKRHVHQAVQFSRIAPVLPPIETDSNEIGRILGLGAQHYHGTILEIEAVAFPACRSGAGSIRFNDTAGTMARDSLFNAASVLRRDLAANIKDYDLHINIVGGAKVDGPSAGLALYLVIVSAITEVPIRQDVAVTGELSLRGRVKPVGAIWEKIQAARQAGLRKVLLPAANLKDVPAGITDLEIVPLDSTEQAYPHIFAGPLPVLTRGV
ncbi:MAG: ATP-dependent protease, Lon family [Syntrophomonadaceae bacterium]|nr:ATP-dependent protease, Lon family [Syntrophomonadaceae bacterium]